MSEESGRDGMRQPTPYVARLDEALCRVMEGKGFSRTLISGGICGAKAFSMGVNILHAGVETPEIERAGEQGWYILYGTGHFLMGGQRHRIGPGMAVFAPATGGPHRFVVDPGSDLTYVIVLAA